MKKTLLILMLASMLAMTARGQMLQNTWWRMYNFSNIPFDYVHFGQDTFSFSTNNIAYFYAATYTTNGNLFEITNTTFWNCALSDTGNYSFTIQNDTLLFSFISDTCVTRHIVLLSYYFVRLVTGAEDLNPISTATISPNPSADGIFNLMFNENGAMPNKIYVMAADGRKILDVGAENFLPLHSRIPTNRIINLQSRASGIYFLVMENEKGRKVYKLVR